MSSAPLRARCPPQAFSYPESRAQTLLDVSCLAGLPIHSLTQALTITQAGSTAYKTRSLSGAALCHRGYSILLTPKQIIQFSHHGQDKHTLHTSGKYWCQQSCPTSISLCSSFTVKPFRS